MDQQPILELNHLAELLVKTSDTPTNRIIADMCRRTAASTEVLGMLCDSVITLESRVKRMDTKYNAILIAFAKIANISLEDLVPPSILKELEAEESAKENK